MAKIQELQTELEKTNTLLLENLANAKALQATMQVGNWGATGITGLNDKLKSVLATVSELQGKKVTIAADIKNEERLKEYNALLKKIETATNTVSERTARMNAADVGSSKYLVLARDVDKAVSALKGLETQERMNFDAQKNRIYNAKARPTEQFFDNPDLEGRLGTRDATPVPEYKGARMRRVDTSGLPVSLPQPAPAGTPIEKLNQLKTQKIDEMLGLKNIGTPESIQRIDVLTKSIYKLNNAIANLNRVDEQTKASGTASFTKIASITTTGNTGTNASQRVSDWKSGATNLPKVDNTASFTKIASITTYAYSTGSDPIYDRALSNINAKYNDGSYSKGTKTGTFNKAKAEADELKKAIAEQQAMLDRAEKRVPKSTTSENFKKNQAAAQSFKDEIAALTKKLEVLDVTMAKTGTTVGHPTGADVGANPPTRPPTDDTPLKPKRTPAEMKAARDAADEALRQSYMKQSNFAKEAADMAKLGFTDPETQFKHNKSVPGGAYSTSRWQRTEEETGRTFISDAKVDPRGNVTQGAIPKAQQSFAQGISKDIGDLLKWSVAIAAIYGPINAMSEAMTQVIENESKLADVSVFLTDGLVSTSKVFDTVYTSAQTAGESVTGVIDAFGAAYTAAGRITNEVERYVAATSLLDDALALSKLSTLDQAGAIDVLTAALYQTADSQEEVSKSMGSQATQSDVATNALSKGRDLLDQWILVSKNASVSVETLATGVAVLGDSAETAGLNIMQMNAMIATLSEVSLSSGKETANIAKALIGNYQQESAVKELNRLGIAVVDTTGKTRQFMDVMKDVYALRSSKILGDQDFNRLTLALGGGGIRRQKDVAAFIENMSRMEQLTKIQESGAGGQTEAALAKKLDTVQTSATQLQNSLLNLAQTLGTSGGLLDTFSLAAKGATAFTVALDGIASAVGKVGPLLIAVGVGSLLMRGKGGAAGMQNMLMNNLGMGAGLAGGITGTRSMFSPTAISFGQGGTKPGTPMPMSLGQKMTTAPMLGAIALPAIQNAMSGDYEEAGANIAGGVAGALVGGPVGALVGSAIAEAFVRTTMTYEQSFVDLFSGAVKPPKDKEGVTGTKQSLEELLADANKTIGGGVNGFGQVAAWWEFNSEIEKKTRSEGSFLKDKWNSYGSVFSGETDQQGSKYSKIEGATLALLQEKDPAKARALRARMAEEGLQPEGTQTKQTKEQIGWSTKPQIDSLNKMQGVEMDRLKEGVIKGDIKQSDYANRMASLSAFTTTATGWMAAVTDESGKLSDAFDSNADAWQQFLNVMGSGNQEAIKDINSRITEATKLQEIIDTWDPKTKGVDFTANGQEFTQIVNINVVKDALAAANAGISGAVRSASDAALLNKMDIRDVYGSNTEATAVADVNTVTQDAIKLQNQYYSNLTNKEYEAKKDSFEEFYMWVEEGGKYIYKKIVDSTGKNLDKNLFGEAYQADIKSGKVKQSGQDGVDWTVGSATKAQYLDAESRAPAFTKMLESKGYSAKIEDTLVTTSDKQTIVSHGDQKVIQYLLQQILDTEKKQLQGIWNLPEGASMWVTAQSADKAGTGATDEPLTDVNGDDRIAKSLAMDEVYKQRLSEANPVGMTGQGNKFDMDAIYRKRLSEVNPSGMTGNAGGDTIDNMYYRRLHSPNPTEGTGGSGGAKSGAGGMEETGIIGQLLNTLRSLFGGAFNYNKDSSRPGGFSPNGGSSMRPLGSSGGAPATPVSNRLDLKLTSTTNLLVDGRVLASIVKPYLAADLMKANESGGTVTRSFVI